MANWKFELRLAHPEIDELISLLHDADEGRRYWKDAINSNKELETEDPKRFADMKRFYKQWNELRRKRKAKLSNLVYEVRFEAEHPEL